MDSVAKPRKKLIISVAAIVVAAIVVMLVLLIYYSPDRSWSSSIRDHDGDGVPDASDPEPFDSSKWSVSTGYINFSLFINSSIGSDFLISVSSTDQEAHWLVDDGDAFLVTYPLDVDGYSNSTMNMTIRWWNGPSSANVTVEIYGDYFWGYPGSFCKWSVIVTDAQTVTVDLTYPDDFTPTYIE